LNSAIRCGGIASIIVLIADGGRDDSGPGRELDGSNSAGDASGDILSLSTMALPPLIFVTGKGGTGKSTVAGALALALARRGITALADLDHRLTAARLLGVRPDGSSASATQNLEVLSLSRRAELEAFIERIVPLKAISRRMLRSHTFGYVTAALPGLEAFLMLERLRLLADQAAERSGFAVVDGPASGGAVELLSVTQGIRDLAPAGTLNRLARTVSEFLSNRQRFGVLLTVRPEQLAVRETLETAALLRDRLAIDYITVVLNGVPQPLFSAAECTKIRPAAHRSLAHQRRAMFELAARARRQFERAGIEVFELPMLYTSTFGREQLRILADELQRSQLLEGMTGGK
jgi:hypothetical protein